MNESLSARKVTAIVIVLVMVVTALVALQIKQGVESSVERENQLNQSPEPAIIR